MKKFLIVKTSARRGYRLILLVMRSVFIAVIPACCSVLIAQIPSSPQSSDLSGVNTPEAAQTFSPASCADPNDLSCNANTNGYVNGLPAAQNKYSISSPQGNYTEKESNHRLRPSTAERQQTTPELTEFQRFVASSTGVLLPRYGADLFRTRPDRFASNEHAAVPDSFILSADDELRIHTWGQVNITADVRVDREGDIFLPKVGPVHVAGLSFAVAQQQVIHSIARVYRNFECTVDLGEIHSIQIYVTGHAAHPGEYSVNALTTLVDAIFQSGGPSPSGSLRHVELKRDGKLVTDFDLYLLLSKGDKSGDAVLRTGDVLFIPAVGSEVALLGSVRTEAVYELRQGETISDLLNMAGGMTALAQASPVSIERIDTSGSRLAFQVALDQQGLSTVLMNGDILRLDSLPSKYSATVTLRGAVASPGHYRWHKGMHLSELMPERDALETRSYWWHRTQLGLPAPEFLDEIANLDAQRPLSAARRLAPARDAQGQNENMKEGSERGVPADQEAAGEQRQPGDPRQTDARHEPGEKETSGSIAERAEDQVNNSQVSLQRPTAETNWNYAVIERLDPGSMRTYLIPFDPGRLVLQHDMSQDLELEPGDVITLFTQDDIALPTAQKTRYVRLEGEFKHAGIYSVAPGESLRSLVLRAGGLTSDAYLYGSVFTRRSTRKLEQQRLDDYTNRLEQEMHHGALNALSQPGIQAGDANTLNRDLIERLHQVKATGRIVLDLHARSTGVDALPDLELEDGDRLVVPARPSTVQVIGAVMNPNAFLYRPRNHAEDYLLEAGGPNRDADKARIFILRADGSVTRSAPRQSIFASSLKAQNLNPGDTIVVPEKVWRPSTLNQLMTWVQLFSEFSLSAAAINTIK